VNRRHLALYALLAVAAPLTFAFCWHGVTLADDSISYIVLARWMSPFAHDPLSAPWAGNFANFPPVFPMLLALTGGAWNFLVAHLLVAACALASLVLVHAYGVRRLGSPLAGFGLAVVFLAMPTAWISITGILTEPLFLALTLAALLIQERGDTGRMRNFLLLGLVFSVALLTRVAGVALIAGYAIHVAIRVAGRRRWPHVGAIIALLMPVVAQLAWLAARPALSAAGYESDAGAFLQFWIEQPAYMANVSIKVLNAAWSASFTADASEPLSIQIVLWAIAALGIAGMVRGAMRNRLDSWYALIGIAIIFFWVFGEDNQRRLLYPLVPLLLVHAGQMLALIGERFGGDKRRRAAMLAGAGLVAAICAPATLLIAQKAIDRAPLFPGSGYSFSAMTDYYSTVNREAARTIAGSEAAVLAGLVSVQGVTPADARVMWTRPDFVAILGHRAGVPFYFRWDRSMFAREVLTSGTTHVVMASLVKVDLDHHSGDLMDDLVRDRPAYLRAIQMNANPANGVLEFMLFEVDRQALQRAVAGDPTR
jgi:4-amino-4-deoxy-L-arabinose transferase-like glycosyltransferase